MRIDIYVRQEDEQLFKRLKAMAGRESLSSLIATVLRKYVEERPVVEAQTGDDWFSR